MAQKPKRCTKCRRVLPASGFHKNRSKPSGLADWCRGCLAVYQRAYRPRLLALHQGLREPTVVRLWNEAFGRLEAYVKREGHARVPTPHVETGFRLGRWVSSKRTDRRSGRLKPEHARRLQALPGWSWDVYGDEFSRGLAALEQFAEREGHCRVPYSHREGSLRLGEWASEMRHCYGRGRLNAHRIGALESVPGWWWNREDERSPAGMQRRRTLEALRRFAEREGHTGIPTGHTENGLKLGHRVARLQRLWKEGRLAPDLRAALEAIPHWGRGVQETQFQRGLRALEWYVKRQGHARVRWDHIQDGFKLGWWVVCRRRDYKKSRLPAHRARALAKLRGWRWDGRQSG